MRKWNPFGPYFWINLSVRFPLLGKRGVGRKEREILSGIIAEIVPTDTPFDLRSIEVTDDWHVYDD